MIKVQAIASTKKTVVIPMEKVRAPATITASAAPIDLGLPLKISPVAFACVSIISVIWTSSLLHGL